MYSNTSDLSNYQAIIDYLKKGKSKLDRPAPAGNGNNNNTRIQLLLDGDTTIVTVRLHDTHIIKFYDDGCIQLNTDGWKTVTTRNRINYYTPKEINVWQEAFIWYINYHSKIYLYEDGMILVPKTKSILLNGRIIEPYTKKEYQKKKKLKKKVDTYCNEFIEKFFDQDIPYPSHADCWFCCMEIKESGINMGDSCNDDHILNHIDEKYFVPSLLNNAIQESNKTGFYRLAPIDNNNIVWAWKGEGWESYNPFALSMTKDRVKLMLKRYINRRLGLGIT